MCLSHCWGLHRPIQTTRTNLDMHIGGIPFLEIPTTFRDFFQVARFLNIRFVWIDSLCIVQDDPEDWLVEAGRMVGIYSNSHLTVCATMSEDSRGGLFRELPSGDSPFTERRVPSAFTGGVDMWYRHRLDHEGLVKLNDPGIPEEARHPPHLPLLSRAWTLQEHLLSPRVVHFTAWEVVWDCSVGLQCLCSSPAAPRITTARAKYASLLADSSPSRMYTYWQELVQMYSPRKLTKPSDRLIALSGIARQIQDAFGDEYLAGTWRASLPNALMWTRVRGSTEQELDENEDGLPKHEYLAPSWSWASINQPVSYEYASKLVDRDLHDFRLLDAYCRANAMDHTGAVNDGFLRVRGRVLTCNLTSYDGHRVSATGAGFKLNFIPDERAWMAQTELDSFYCLHLGSGNQIGAAHPYGMHYFMIMELLERKGTYVRRGLAELYTEQIEDVLANAVLQELTIV